MAIADDIEQLGKNQTNLQKNLTVLKKRLEKLEQRMDAVEGTAVDAPAEFATTSRQSASVAQEESPEQAPAKETSKPIENLGFKVFGGVGFGLILLGLIFLYKYAVDEGLLGYGGRIAIGVLFSLAFIVGGEVFRRKEYAKFGQLLTGGGLGLLYFTFYAAYAFPASRAALGMTATVNYLLLFIVLAVAIMLALRNNSMLLTAYAFVLGYAAPLLIGAADGRMSIHAVMIPALLLSIALAVILRYRPWPLGVFGAVASFLVYTIAFFAQNVLRYVPGGVVPPIVGPAFMYLLLLAGLWNLLALVLPDDARSLQNIAIAILSAIMLVAFGLALADQYWETYAGAYLILLAAVTLGLTGLAKARNLRVMFSAYFIICITLVTIAIPVQLDSYWIALAWAVEGLLLVRSGVLIEVRGLRVLGYASLLLALGNTLFFGSGLPTVQRLVSYVGTIAALFGSAALVASDPEKDELRRYAVGALTVAGTLLLTILLAVEIWAPNGIFMGATSNVRHVTLSIAWALEAIVCIVLGFTARSRAFRVLGAGLFGVVVLKVLFMDLGALRGLFRTLVTIVVGVIALAGSFAYIRNKERIEKYLKGDA